MSEGTYFQFPISVISMPRTPEEIYALIISFSIVSAGEKRLAILSDDEDERLEYCAKFNLAESHANSKTLAAHIGAEICGVRIGHAASSIERYETVKSWDGIHGRNIMARITTTILFDAKDRGRLSWREFQILVAIYSLIGKKTYAVAITQSMIEARCCGYANQTELTSAIEAGTCHHRLTEKQVRGTIIKLWELKFFARVTPSRHGRVVYYSHRMTDDQLRSKILVNKAYKARFHAEQEVKNRALEKGIKAYTKPRQKGDERATIIESSFTNERASEGRQAGDDMGDGMGDYNTNP